MLSAANLRIQDYQFQQATPQGMWRWTTRMDLGGPSPAFSVRDILSPYGLLRDSIPLPGMIIQAMAESIGQLQASFAPSILVSPLMLVFTQDEGRGYGDTQNLSVTNNGIFGALLNVSVTTDAPYVVGVPPQLGNLSSTESGQIEVSVTSADLIATNSPYSQTLSFQDPSAPNSPVSALVTIIVRPKATIEVSPTTLTFYATRPLTGTFPPTPSQAFVLSNTGEPDSRLAYLVQKLTCTSPWLVSVTPTEGELFGGLSQNITVTVAPSANCLPGTYTEILRVSGYSSNKYQDVQVTLIVL